MIEVRGLEKSYGSVTALRGVDLEVPEGEFVTLFGPNGAGKTTFTKILATLTRPSAGTVLVDGDPIDQGVTVRSKIGLVSHKSFLYGDLTSKENLQFYAKMYGLDNPGPRIEEVLDDVGLRRRANEPVRGFSRGMEQRLAIARALLHEPPFLILDEPYTGLDLAAADMLRGVLGKVLEMSRTVIMTTHDVERGLEFCERAVILADGEIRFDEEADMSPDDFRDTYTRLTAG